MSLEGVVFDWVGICTSKWAPCGAVAVGWLVGGGAVRVTAGLDGRGMGGDRVVGGQGALLTALGGLPRVGFAIALILFAGFMISMSFHVIPVSAPDRLLGSFFFFFIYSLSVFNLRL